MLTSLFVIKQQLDPSPYDASEEEFPEVQESPDAVSKRAIDNLEKTLKEKVEQKIHGGPFQLRRAFKQFDSHGTGYISYREFKRCLEYGGLTGTEKDIRGLFNRYDATKNGNISYNDFVKSIFPKDFSSPLQTSIVPGAGKTPGEYAKHQQHLLDNPQDEEGIDKGKGKGLTVDIVNHATSDEYMDNERLDILEQRLQVSISTTEWMVNTWLIDIAFY